MTFAFLTSAFFVSRSRVSMVLFINEGFLVYSLRCIGVTFF